MTRRQFLGPLHRHFCRNDPVLWPPFSRTRQVGSTGAAARIRATFPDRGCAVRTGQAHLRLLQGADPVGPMSFAWSLDLHCDGRNVTGTFEYIGRPKNFSGSLFLSFASARVKGRFRMGGLRVCEGTVGPSGARLTLGHPKGGILGFLKGRYEYSVRRGKVHFDRTAHHGHISKRRSGRPPSASTGCLQYPQPAPHTAVPGLPRDSEHRGSSQPPGAGLGDRHLPLSQRRGAGVPGPRQALPNLAGRRGEHTPSPRSESPPGWMP